MGGRERSDRSEEAPALVPLRKPELLPLAPQELRCVQGCRSVDMRTGPELGSEVTAIQHVVELIRNVLRAALFGVQQSVHGCLHLFHGVILEASLQDSYLHGLPHSSAGILPVEGIHSLPGDSMASGASRGKVVRLRIAPAVLRSVEALINVLLGRMALSPGDNKVGRVPGCQGTLDKCS